jgi:hypothetical protein
MLLGHGTDEFYKALGGAPIIVNLCALSFWIILRHHSRASCASACIAASGVVNPSVTKYRCL